MLYLTVILSLPFLQPVTSPEVWQSLGESDGVQLWQRPEPKPSVLTFRSRSVVLAPIAVVSAVLWDADHRCEWLSDCRESVVLESRGKSINIQYARNKSGPLLPDRDVVVQNVLSLEPAAKSVRLEFHSVDDARRPPQQWVVRMPRLEGYFLLRELSANSTEVVYQASLDPGGGVPSFMSRQPTLDKLVMLHHALRERLRQRPDDAALAQLRRALDWRGFDVKTTR